VGKLPAAGVTAALDMPVMAIIVAAGTSATVVASRIVRSFRAIRVLQLVEQAT
jgi:hypothetical protein